MPFVSKAQQRYAFGTHQPWAKKFAAATTDFKDLPEHASPRQRALHSIKTSRRKARKG